MRINSSSNLFIQGGKASLVLLFYKFYEILNMRFFLLMQSLNKGKDGASHSHSRTAQWQTGLLGLSIVNYVVIFSYSQVYNLSSDNRFQDGAYYSQSRTVQWQTGLLSLSVINYVVIFS